MEIREILKMIDEDIACVETQLPDDSENINSLLSELSATLSMDKHHVAKKLVATQSMWEFLIQPGNFIKILECKDLLTLGGCLPMLAYLPWVENTEYEQLCLEAAFCALYTHFQSGDILEKGLAAIDIIKLLRRHFDKLTPCFEEFLQMAYDREDIHKQMDEVDFQYDSQLLFLQIEASMLPFMRFVCKMYPTLVEEEMNEFCEKVEETLADFELSQQKMMLKTQLFYNYILEEDIRSY